VLRVLEVLTGLKVHRRVALALAAALLLVSCRQAVEPIRVDGRRLVVENRTKNEWRDVTVTVNGYYRGGARTLAPGGQLDAPLANFVTGLGQRFDVNRERVWRVEVRATSDAGPVSIDWDRKGQRP
jgi:hypothetical protein